MSSVTAPRRAGNPVRQFVEQLAGVDRMQVALLAAVRAAPLDDLPRLVFADWLEEHGQPERAILIRKHCQAGGVPVLPADVPILLGFDNSLGVHSPLLSGSQFEFARGLVCGSFRWPAGWTFQQVAAMFCRHPVDAVQVSAPLPASRVDEWGQRRWLIDRCGTGDGRGAEIPADAFDLLAADLRDYRVRGDGPHRLAFPKRKLAEVAITQAGRLATDLIRQWIEPHASHRRTATKLVRGTRRRPVVPLDDG